MGLISPGDVVHLRVDLPRFAWVPVTVIYASAILDPTGRFNRQRLIVLGPEGVPLHVMSTWLRGWKRL